VPAAGRPGPAAARNTAIGFWAEFSAGLRQFAQSRYLVALLTIGVICQLGAGALLALNVFFARNNLHAAYDLYGYLGMAFGAGSVIGALCTGRVVRRIGARSTTCLSTLLAGLLVIVYARQGQFWPGVVLFFLAAAPVAMLNTAITPLMLAATPREFLGRMVAVFNPVLQLASTVSVVLAGLLDSTVLRTFALSVAGMHVGAIDTIFTACGLLILVAAGYGMLALPHGQAVPEAVTA
jgi:MFS family permease